MQRAIKDLLAGATFIGFGLAFAVGAATYDVGSALRMGPGYFPLVLGGLLAVLGVVIIVRGTVAGEDEAIGPIPWRSAAVITGAILFFGVTIRDLGVVPSTFVTALVAGFAGRRPGVVAPLVIALGLTLASYVIFVWALQLTLPVWGDWIPV